MESSTDPSENIRVTSSKIYESISTPGDVRVTGSLIVNGPMECSNVIVSGSIIVKDDLVCDDLRVSGSMNVDGNVTCEKDMKISGGAQIIKNAQVYGHMKISGGATINGLLIVEQAKISGKLKVHDNIMCTNEFRVSGKLVAKAIQASSFKSTGKVDIEELIDSKLITMFSSGKSKIGSIKGNSIELLTRKNKLNFDETTDSNLILDLIRNVIEPFIENNYSRGSYLIQGSIQGNRIILEDAEINGDVIGDYVELRGNTIVHGTIYYTEQLTLENKEMNVTSKHITSKEKETFQA